MQELSSLQNRHVKTWRQLHTKKGRQRSKTFLVEGVHLVQEALASSLVGVCAVMFTEEAATTREVATLVEEAGRQGVPCFKITAEIADELSDTETHQGIFAEVTLPDASQLQTEQLNTPLLLLDGVQDPGNVGTMIRTADACGFAGVILGRGTADPFSPKTVRSTQGSLFHLPVVTAELAELIPQLQRQQIPVYGTALDVSALTYTEIAPRSLFALIVGNEGAGVSPKHLALVDQTLYIPIRGAAESLNVGIAAGILMYHLYDPMA